MGRHCCASGLWVVGRPLLDWGGIDNAVLYNPVSRYTDKGSELRSHRSLQWRKAGKLTDFNKEAMTILPLSMTALVLVRAIFKCKLNMALVLDQSRGICILWHSSMLWSMAPFLTVTVVSTIFERWWCCFYEECYGIVLLMKCCEIWMLLFRRLILSERSKAQQFALCSGCYTAVRCNLEMLRTKRAMKGVCVCVIRTLFCWLISRCDISYGPRDKALIAFLFGLVWTFVLFLQMNGQRPASAKRCTDSYYLKNGIE